MADILLTHGYFLLEDEKERKIMKPYPPLGLLYISAYQRRAGFDVEIYDGTWGSKAGLYERLAREPGGVLGIYTNLITRANVVAITAEAKRHGWTVVLGGPESANYTEQYLAHGADVVVVGEGEETLAELLPTLASRGPHRLQGIAGTAFRDARGDVPCTFADRHACSAARVHRFGRRHCARRSRPQVAAARCCDRAADRAHRTAVFAAKQAGRFFRSE